MGRDKALLPCAGGTLVERVVAAVALRCDPVFVIAAPGQRLPVLPAEVLRDDVGGVGPLLATGRGLRAAAWAGVHWAFVCAVDMPFVSAELIDELACFVAGRDIDVVLPSDGHDHFLAALYRTALADPIDVLVAGGARSMRSLVDAVGVQRVVPAESRPLTNLNTVADLHWIR
jgi:molybdenum cofactor guanylyltransferase